MPARRLGVHLDPLGDGRAREVGVLTGDGRGDEDGDGHASAELWEDEVPGGSGYATDGDGTQLDGDSEPSWVFEGPEGWRRSPAG